jgi:hypothetical protein
LNCWDDASRSAKLTVLSRGSVPTIITCSDPGRPDVNRPFVIVGARASTAP